MWEVVAIYCGAHKVLKEFYNYQNAKDYIKAMNGHYIDSYDRCWELTLRPTDSNCFC